MAQHDLASHIITEDIASRYFDSLFSNQIYTEKISSMISNEESRLSVNMDHLRQINDRLPSYVIENPQKAIQALEKRLGDVVRDMGEYGKSSEVFRVTFEGNFGKYHVTPRGLEASLANQLVRVQGIVTKASVVRPKLLQSVHYCEATSKGHTKNYADQYEISEVANINNTYPKADMDGNPLMTEFGLCKYKAVQFLSMQEIPERAPTGQLPRSVDIVLEADLVDKVKPGDRVEVVGIFKTVANTSSTNMGIFKTVILANNVFTLMSEISTPVLSSEDLSQIKAFSKTQGALMQLSRSLAPSIFGHDQIKKALLLMLLGGVEKNLENKTHLRGDMNILMIGDPSTAKSQLLRTVLNIAPLAINTTGRGSSGVGLTAAVNYDKDSGERFLEAGAMVLADRGIVCIDEFDKMNDVDRVTIHEVMEQQTVTIAKAGIHASLNARCSVLAAANPIYGSYQKNLPPTKNIALPDSLLSRFDLIFIVLDQKLPELDKDISRRVIMNHILGSNAAEERFDQDSSVIEPRPISEEEETVHTQYGDQEILSRQFLKKYIYYAKQTMAPSLTEEACSHITEAWTRLRTQDEEGRNKAVAITARTLETMIRLSTAVAKLYLSDTVEVSHCDEALSLLRFAIYAEEQSHMPEIVPIVPAQPTTPTRSSVHSTPRRGTRRRPADPNEEISSTLQAQVSTTRPDLKSLVTNALLEAHDLNNIIATRDIWAKVRAEFNRLNGSYEDFMSIIRGLDAENRIMYSADSETISVMV